MFATRFHFGRCLVVLCVRVDLYSTWLSYSIFDRLFFVA